MTALRSKLNQAIAQFALGRLAYADLPDVAVNALELGYDGSAIRRLASFVKPSYFDLGDPPERALAEMGIAGLSKQEASIFLAKQTAKEILSGEKEPLSGAYEIWLLCFEAGCPNELVSFGGLDQDFNVPQILEECKRVINLRTRLDPP